MLMWLLITSQESEPEIWNAIRFGAILENVVFDEYTREVDFMSKCVATCCYCLGFWHPVLGKDCQCIPAAAAVTTCR